MCQASDFSCDSTDQVLSAYRRQREAGQISRAAYIAALHAFENRHPDTGVFEAMSAVKEALSGESELGLVDSGA